MYISQIMLANMLADIIIWTILLTPQTKLLIVKESARERDNNKSLSNYAYTSMVTSILGLWSANWSAPVLVSGQQSFIVLHVKVSILVRT